MKNRKYFNFILLLLVIATMLFTSCSAKDTAYRIPDDLTISTVMLEDGSFYSIISSSLFNVPNQEVTILQAVDNIFKDKLVKNMIPTYSAYYGSQRVVKIEIYYRDKPIVTEVKNVSITDDKKEDK